MVTLQERWGLTAWRTAAVLMAFSLAGMTTVVLKGPIVSLILAPDAPGWLQWTVYLAVMLPVYHAMLLGYGTLLGQFDFFWKRTQAAGRLLRRGSSRRSGASRSL